MASRLATAQRIFVGDYTPTIEPVHVGRGVACFVSNIPGGPSTGPASYAISDIGKPGVPRLDARDELVVRRITRYVHAPSLRFAVTPTRGLVVFNAVAGPCSGGAPGYFVLNGYCNEYYQPAEPPFRPHATPGCLLPPRPWIPHDRGIGSPAWWGSPASQRV